MDIIIVGGGIGGLTLANALAQKAPGCRFTILERDAAPSARNQGYGIGLRRSEGLAAMPIT